MEGEGEGVIESEGEREKGFAYGVLGPKFASRFQHVYSATLLLNSQGL